MRNTDPSATLYVNKTTKGGICKFIVLNRAALTFIEGWQRVSVEFSQEPLQFILTRDDERGNRRIIALSRKNCVNSRIYVTDFVPLAFPVKQNFDIVQWEDTVLVLMPALNTRVFDARSGIQQEVEL